MKHIYFVLYDLDHVVFSVKLMLKLTIRDIAALSGVGKSTVSRVLNNDPGVKESTRQRVEAVITKYNYTPSQAARALNNKEIKSIGIIVGKLGSQPEANSLSQIIRYFEDVGYESVILESRRDRGVFERHVSFLKQKRVDGLMFFGFSGITDIEFEETDFNGNIISIITNTPSVTSIALDTKKAVDLCFEHLILEPSIKNIGFIGVSEQDYFSGKARLEAYREKCLEHSIEPISITEMRSYADGQSAFLEMAKKEVDAVICGTERLAAGAMLEVLRSDSHIQIASVGLTDHIKLLGNYKCATDLQYQEIGLRGAQCLFSLINGETPERLTSVTPILFTNIITTK